jgi:hypothetical protein
MIIGRDLLKALGIDINFRDHTIEWNGNVAAFTANKMISSNQPKEEKEVKKVPDETQQVKPEDLLPKMDNEEAKQMFLQLLTSYNDFPGRL